MELTEVGIEQAQNEVIKKRYEVDGVGVDVSVKEYSTSKEETNPKEAILSFPGWAMDINTPSTKLLNQSLAESGRRTLAVSTKSDSVIPERERVIT